MTLQELKFRIDSMIKHEKRDDNFDDYLIVNEDNRLLIDIRLIGAPAHEIELIFDDVL